MDLFEKLDQLLDAAEPDPRPRMKKATREIIKFEMQHVPAAIAAEIVDSRLEVLGKALVEIIEGRDTREWVEVVFALRDELRRIVAHERADGRLKPPTNGVDERLAELSAHGKGSAEIENLRTMSAADDPLKHVDFFFVTTVSGRRITVDEIRAFGRPAGWSNDRTWAARFMSDEKLRELEAEAARNANPQPQYGRNLDFPGGVRPNGFGR